MAKKYCDGIDCQWCSEKEPCIYKIANKQSEIIDEIKEIAITHDEAPCLDIDYNCNICHDEITEYGKRCMSKGLREILNKCEAVNNAK